MGREIKRVIIHCSDSLAGDVHTIREMHLKKGWQDIGYHFVIPQNGDVQAGRLEMAVGAHCEGHNFDSIGVCLVGKLHHFQPVQLESLKDLVCELCRNYGLTHEQVFAHYELDKKGKTCPDLDANLLRAFIKTGLLS